MYISIEDLIEELKESFDYDDKVLSYRIKVKKSKSTCTKENPNYPNDEDWFFINNYWQSISFKVYYLHIT